jgi:hypothetical protein
MDSSTTTQQERENTGAQRWPTPIKTKKHGGKRPGAGRKPNLVKRLIGRLVPSSASQILDRVDVKGTIVEIMKKGSLALKQRTLADLTDRAWGRPAQAVSVSGAVVHAHWTPGKYSHLTDEEFAKLAELSAKALGSAHQDTAQNGPGFQEKSTVAIEAERGGLIYFTPFPPTLVAAQERVTFAGNLHAATAFPQLHLLPDKTCT